MIRENPTGGTPAPKDRLWVRGSSLEGGLKDFRESEPELARKIEETATGDSHLFTPEEIAKIQRAVPPNKLGNFLSGYASHRWGSFSIEWRDGESGKFHQENNAAGCWRRLSPEERLEFYLNMTREEAEEFFGSKTGIKIKMKDSPQYRRPAQ